ncbi:hypothetical protein MMC25_000018 [Agyrium rufum]|nr:hypothetical protein [Agyrium rufum]
MKRKAKDEAGTDAQITKKRRSGRTRAEAQATAASDRPKRGRLIEVTETKPFISTAQSTGSKIKAKQPKSARSSKPAMQISAEDTASINTLEKPKTKSSEKVTTAKPTDAEKPANGSIRAELSFWLMKAEPFSRIEKGKDVKFSIDDLAAATKPEAWDGVRNLIARNNMRAMKKGELAFFYHSNCPTPGIAGIMEIVCEHSVDESAFDPNHPYYDEKSSRDNPKWSYVHVEFRKKFPGLVKLKDLQQYKGPGQPLENLQTLKQSRLSVSKVTQEEWDFIISIVPEE